MSGHSKWATIKRKKGDLDAKRGKVFSKILREIAIAARKGGSNAETNSYLRTIIAKAKAVNMPADNIKRAIQKGAGEIEGANYEEITYEGYGPAGIAIYIEAATDNKNRTSADIRAIFSKHGGSLGESGCVSWMFQKMGLISISKNNVNEEEILSLALEEGAEDVAVTEDTYDVITLPENFEKVKTSIEAKKIQCEIAEVSMIPKNYIKIQGNEAKQLLALIETLEDNDDVSNVCSNFDIPDDELSICDEK
ncbi:MAG: YebC/PmpR family DNA-binding transcriptional regulator [Candidatus Firestonebacteria bacterium]